MQKKVFFSILKFIHIHSFCVSHFSHVQLLTPWTVACQAPLSVGFSRQEYWSGLPFPSPEDLSDPGTEPEIPALHLGSPVLTLVCTKDFRRGMIVS